MPRRGWRRVRRAAHASPYWLRMVSPYGLRMISSPLHGSCATLRTLRRFALRSSAAAPQLTRLAAPLAELKACMHPPN